MFNRNKKSTDQMTQYYYVIGFFVAVCVFAVIFTFVNPKQKFSEMMVIDDSQILVHNGQGHQFKHGRNELFEMKTLADARTMFQSAISDTNQINPCATSMGLDGVEEEDIDVPESYDWREAYPDCVQPVQSVGTNCSASYAFATLSAVEDRICMSNNQTVKLSTQEVVDCDPNSFGCDGGYVNKVLNWGRKKGFILDECMEYKGTKAECEVDHLESNMCRVDSQFYRIQDYCISYQPENIMREIIKNGPVIGQITPFTDFLAYKDGLYHRTEEAFKFNGQHIVKIVGWSKSMDGSTEWIIENSWGPDWGENGYARIHGKGELGIEQYAMAPSIIPYTAYDYYSMQQMVDATSEEGVFDTEDIEIE